MCDLDGINFAALRDELDCNEGKVQQCLAYLNSHGYVTARALPSLKVRYGVTELGWSVCELVSSLKDRESAP